MAASVPAICHRAAAPAAVAHLPCPCGEPRVLGSTPAARTCRREAPTGPMPRPGPRCYSRDRRAWCDSACAVGKTPPFAPPQPSPLPCASLRLAADAGSLFQHVFLPLNTKLVRYHHQVNYGDPGAPTWPLGRADRGLAVLWAAAACLPTRVLTRARCSCSKCSCGDLEHTPESQWSLLGRQVTWGPLTIATRAR